MKVVSVRIVFNFGCVAEGHGLSWWAAAPLEWPAEY